MQSKWEIQLHGWFDHSAKEGHSSWRKWPEVVGTTWLVSKFQQDPKKTSHLREGWFFSLCQSLLAHWESSFASFQFPLAIAAEMSLSMWVAAAYLGGKTHAIQASHVNEHWHRKRPQPTSSHSDGQKCVFEKIKRSIFSAHNNLTHSATGVA